MILCVQLDLLGKQLSTLAPLMDRYQRRDLQFCDAALRWLEEAEQTMSRLRLPEGAEMSSLRGQILKAADQLDGAGERLKRSVARRIREAAAAEALGRAEEVLRHRVLAAEERLRMFDDKLAEGMTAFLLENPLPENNQHHNAWLNLIWQRLKENNATRPLCTYLAASLSATDRSYLLHRVVDRVLEEMPEPSPAEPSPAEPSPAEPSPTEPSPAEPPSPEPPPPEPSPTSTTHAVSEIEGIGPATQSKLVEAGIATIADLLRLCATPGDRRAASRQTGLSEEQLHAWVDMADLMRIPGLSGQSAELMKASGVDSVLELAQRNPDNLAAALTEQNAKRKLVPSVPTLAQVRGWIEIAKTLDRIVTH